MTQLLGGVSRENETKVEHDIARITRVKELHGARVEEELGTLKNDYFKDEHYASNPNLKILLSEAVKLSARTRQAIDMEAAEQLLEKVMQIAEIFYKTKNVTPVRVKSLYPTEGQIVTYSE
jgi:nickel superoxide dismutase